MGALTAFLIALVQMIEQHTGPVTAADGRSWNTWTHEEYQGDLHLSVEEMWINDEHLVYAYTSRPEPIRPGRSCPFTATAHVLIVPLDQPEPEQAALF